MELKIPSKTSESQEVIESGNEMTVIDCDGTFVRETPTLSSSNYPATGETKNSVSVCVGGGGAGFVLW